MLMEIAMRIGTVPNRRTRACSFGTNIHREAFESLFHSRCFGPFMVRIATADPLLISIGIGIVHRKIVHPFCGIRGTVIEIECYIVSTK